MYGLTDLDLEMMREKVEFQAQYLDSNHLISSNGEVKPLRDLSYSANHSVRYYGRLVNKINTMTDYATVQGLVPVFITGTADGYFRDILFHGDYTRLTRNGRIAYGEKLRRVPRGKVYGFVREKMKRCMPLNEKDIYNVLNYQCKLFLSSPSFKRMRKDGFQYHYIKSTEPHKNGVPHMHMLLFIPRSFIDRVKIDFEKYFTAPRNRKKLPRSRTGETFGFQWNITNPAGYILKYVTKSFCNVKNGDELDYLQAWYIKHRINRVTTSKSIIPQWVYSKLSILENDWYYLNEINNNGYAEWSKDDDYIYFQSFSEKREIIYEKGVYQLISNGEIVEEIEIPHDFEILDNRSFVEDKPILRSDLKTELPIPVEIDGELFHLSKSTLIPKPSPKPGSMFDLDLYRYYESLNINDCDMNHYAYVARCMIERGLMGGSSFTGKELDNAF